MNYRLASILLAMLWITTVRAQELQVKININTQQVEGSDKSNNG